MGFFKKPLNDNSLQSRRSAIIFFQSFLTLAVVSHNLEYIIKAYERLTKFDLAKWECPGKCTGKLCLVVCVCVCVCVVDIWV